MRVYLRKRLSVKKGKTSLFDECEHRVKQLMVTYKHIELKDLRHTLNVTKMSVYRIVHDF